MNPNPNPLNPNLNPVNPNPNPDPNATNFLNPNATNCLKQKILNQELLVVGSDEEIAIRQGTIVAADLIYREIKRFLSEKLKTLGPIAKFGESNLESIVNNYTVANLDYYLWKTTVAWCQSGKITFPFHRARTFCY